MTVRVGIRNLVARVEVRIRGSGVHSANKCPWRPRDTTVCVRAGVWWGPWEEMQPVNQTNIFG